MAISCLGFFIMCMVLCTCVFGFTKKYPPSTFDQSFTRLYGDDHVIFLDSEGKSVQISLDQTSGSGFISKNFYLHAYFSASIKLPAVNYTAGVVVTFYTSNGQKYKGTHDELDFELLGHITGQPWVVQTNVYGNGSENRGREERYTLWFDPTKDFHSYTIVWTTNLIIFYVDNVPIRVTHNVKAMGGDFPSKPMSLYATIWDGSDWATCGGKCKIDYTYAPFIAMFQDFVLHGCSINPTQNPPNCDSNDSDLESTFKGLTSEEKIRMKKFRLKYLFYSYCDDRQRYPTPLPECLIDPQEAVKF